MKHINLKSLTELIDNHKLRSLDRCRENVWKRAAISFFLRDNGFSLEMIGTMLNRNHATIIHSLKIYNNNINYRDFYNFVTEFEEELNCLYIEIDETGFNSLPQQVVNCMSFTDFMRLKKQVMSKMNLIKKQQKNEIEKL